MTTPTVLRRHGNRSKNEALLLQVEATVFLDGQAIGGFDARHPSLLLPERAYDGQLHAITLQAYTYTPLPFDGLTIHARNQLVWHLYHLMHTTFEASLTMSKHEIVRQTLLERLNAAYNMLDLRKAGIANISLPLHL